MAEIDQAFALLMRHEGGFVNDPDDPGGPTNWGVTQGVYSAWLGRAASAADVQAMPQSVAKQIVQARYWAPLRAGELKNQEVATRVLDLSVLRGVSAGAKSMQAAVGAKQDGVVGPVTLAAINAAKPAVFLNTFRGLCVRAFAGIVAGRPTSAKYLVNWVGRAEEIAASVNALL